MAALDRYAAVRPTGSVAAPTWFNLGDRDLATHLFRTARLGEGATLTEVTAEITRAWGLDITLLPMTDDRLRTMVTVAERGEIGFQDYFVRLRHDVEVEAVRFDHARRRPVSAGTRRARDGRRRGDRPVEPARVDRADPCVARCRRAARRAPRIGRRRLADRRRRRPQGTGRPDARRARPRVVGRRCRRLYRSIAATLVIDPADEPLAGAVEATGMRCVVTPSVMTTLDVASRPRRGDARRRAVRGPLSGAERDLTSARSTATTPGGSGPGPATPRSGAARRPQAARRSARPRSTRRRAPTGHAPTSVCPSRC